MSKPHNQTRIFSCLAVLATSAWFLTITSAGDKQPGKGDIPEVVLFFDRGEDNPKERTMRFGLIVTHQRDAATPTGFKQLTYHPHGLTNNTCIKIDGKEYLLGHPPGKWVNPEVKLGKNEQGKQRLGMESVYLYDENIQVTQTAEIVAGRITGKMDTCLVRYTLENKGKDTHKVGLRFLLDTYIGRNDGAPFLVPGRKTLCEDQADFKTPDSVPLFIQAIETHRLEEPGTIAHLNPRPLPELEAPSRLTLGGWPDAETNIAGAKDGLTLWEVPVFSLLKKDDSAAVLYWEEKDLKPGEKRQVGFSYGLGHLTSEDKGKLGLIVAGNLFAGEDLTVMALIRDPKKGHSVTLKEQPGIELLQGERKQEVALPSKDGTQITTLTWKVRLKSAGDIPIVVDSSDGISHREVVTVGQARKPK